MAQSDMHPARKIAKRTTLPLGISPCLPAIRNRAQSIDINIDEIATFSGDASPKNKAISLPDEKPAPIAVPTYSAAVLNAFFTLKRIAKKVEILRKSQNTKARKKITPETLCLNRGITNGRIIVCD